MTVASSTSKSGPYTGNGATTVFAFAFKVQAATDIKVVRTVTTDGVDVDTVLTVAVDYTVSVNADQSTSPGGSVTMLSAPSASQRITILRNVSATQGASIPNQGGFYPKVVENALDKLTMLYQQVAEELARALKISVTQSASDLPATLASIADSEANAVASAAAASQSATAASDSETAAAASAAAINLPSIAGNGSNMLRAKIDESGMEYRTPAQVRGDISAAQSGVVTGSGLTMTTARLLGRTTAGSGAVEEIAVSGATLSAGTLTIASGMAAATQAEMEAASSNTVATTPLNTNWHPGVAKAWLCYDQTGTLTVLASHNITSLTDDGVGILTVTIGTDFSSASYAILATGTNAKFSTVHDTPGPTAGSFQLRNYDVAASLNDISFGYVACFGDQ